MVLLDNQQAHKTPAVFVFVFIEFAAQGCERFYTKWPFLSSVFQASPQRGVFVTAPLTLPWTGNRVELLANAAEADVPVHSRLTSGR